MRVRIKTLSDDGEAEVYATEFKLKSGTISNLITGASEVCSGFL